MSDYLDGGKWELLGEFTKVETGKRNSRPELQKAIAACKKQRARLVIAKLDRLSRNLAFIATMMEHKVDFVCVDNPTATKFTIHILAAVAEHERDMIATRTREAYAAARRAGKRIGNPRPCTEQPQGRARACGTLPHPSRRDGGPVDAGGR